MPDSNKIVLSEAVARNCAAVLSLPSAGMLRHQKSRFLSESPNGLWLEVNSGEFALIEELIAGKQSAGISFRSGQVKVVFATPILQLEREHRINQDTSVSAILVSHPQEIKTIQRRDNYRVNILNGSEITARVWRIAPRVYIGERPSSTAELKIHFRDLSVGGMGVTFFGKDGKPPKIDSEDRLRVELKLRDVSLLLEGRMRESTTATNTEIIATGIQFKEMGKDLEGRQKLSQLTRIIGEMQREEVRRSRIVGAA